MTDVYKKVAQALDQMPEGYPETESGVELKLLKKIYTEADAEIFLKLRRKPDTAEMIAKRLDKPVDETRSILDTMAENGQIASYTLGGKQRYSTAPFVPGIYEFQINRLDAEFVQLMDEYFPTFHKALGQHYPAVARTVPVHETVTSESKIQPYNDVRKLFDKAKSFRVMDCICRIDRNMLGEGCDHELENCLTFSREENAYDYFSIAGRVIDKSEALEIISNSAQQGLVHNVLYNVQEGQGAVCNCCSCSCGLLRSAKELKTPNVVAASDFVAKIDQDECSACGECAEERCPMEAIIESDGYYEVQPKLCIGCGVCAVTCPTEAITLELKPAAEKVTPPVNMREWFTTRATNRGLVK